MNPTNAVLEQRIAAMEGALVGWLLPLGWLLLRLKNG